MAPTVEENIQTLKNAYAAFARQDIPTVLAAFDPNIEWYSPDELPGGGTFHGIDGVVRFFQSLPENYDELHVEPDSFVGSGDRVVVLGRLHGKLKGQQFDVGFAMAWIMRDGKAIKFREYSDSGKLLKIFEREAATTA